MPSTTSHIVSIDRWTGHSTGGTCRRAPREQDMAVMVQSDVVARFLLVRLGWLHRFPPREEPPAQPSAGRVGALVHSQPASFGPEKCKSEAIIVDFHLK